MKTITVPAAGLTLKIAGTVQSSAFEITMTNGCQSTTKTCTLAHLTEGARKLPNGQTRDIYLAAQKAIRAEFPQARAIAFRVFNFETLAGTFASRTQADEFMRQYQDEARREYLDGETPCRRNPRFTVEVVRQVA